MKINGIEGMSLDHIQRALEQGGKFVYFQYCISVLIMSFRRSSEIYFIRPGENPTGKGIKYALVSFFFGWWGIPWGPIWSCMTIATNLGGGKNVTRDVMASLCQQPAIYNPSPSPPFSPPSHLQYK